jgi:type IVB pilus formation R64 PilN family outer membrane protein
MRNFKFLMGLLAASVAVTGCTATPQASRNVDDVSARANQGLATSAQPLPAADKSPIKIHNGVFVGTKAVRNENGDPLPGKFERPNGVEIVRAQSVGLREIAAAVTEQTKIPIVLAAGAPSGSTHEEKGTTAQDATSAPALASGPANGLAAGPIPANFPLDQALAEIQGKGGNSGGNSAGSISVSSPSISSNVIPINYAGPLSGLLDIVSAHFNVAWRYDGGKIVLDQVVTRSFDVPALSIAASLSFDLTSKSDSDTGTSGSTAKTNSTTDVFSEIDTGLKSLVGEGSYAINKATGVVTVTANPATVSRVSTYIEGLNERLSDQVALSVKVYSVTLTDSEAFNLDIAGIFKKSGKYGISLGNAAAATAAPAVGGVEGAGFGWALLNPSSDWYGSNALVEALSTAGKVSEVRNLNQVTLNGIPVPIQVGEKRDYVRKVETTTDSEGNLTYSIDPATISTGFSMQLAPRIQRDGDVILQYGLNMSELAGANDGFDNYSTPDGTSLQLARVKQRNFIQQARIPNGNTLVLAGFDQTVSKDSQRGTGHPSFPLFGGGRDSSVEHTIIVIAITPTVLKK